MEQSRIQKQLHKLGVQIVPLHTVVEVGADHVRAVYEYAPEEKTIPANSVVLVGAMQPVDELYHALIARNPEWEANGVRRVIRIGDCFAPGTIQSAVWSGHKFARELDLSMTDDVPFKRESVALAPYDQ